MRACMLAYTFYSRDARVKRYAEALAQKGNEVDVFTLVEQGLPGEELIDGVRIHRIHNREGNEKRKFEYLYNLLKFFFLAFFEISRTHFKKPYDLVHVHNVPDFLVFAAIWPKLNGAKIILDIHDIVPEFYTNKFKSKNALMFRLLVLVEKISVMFSDHVIISNHLWEKLILSRSTNSSRCTTIINYPDLSIFSKKGEKKNSEKFIAIYPGSMNWHQGLDIAIKAFAIVKDRLPNAEFHIYGDGPYLEYLQSLTDHLDLSETVLFKGKRSLAAISEVIASSDFGIVPKRANSFGGQAFSTKILEFMAAGVPVIVSDTEIDKFYFNDNMVKFFTSEDENDLARCIMEINNDQELRKSLIEHGNDYIEQNNWKTKKEMYFKIIENLNLSY
jgi:glycosyltransferase involved in cell wall biosynthesis